MKRFSIVLYLFFISLVLADELDYLEPKEYKSPSGEPYFPKDLNIRFTEDLRVMKEPSLYAIRDSDKTDAFRFLFVPTFSKPIAYRAFKEDSSYFIQVSRLTHAGGYGTGNLEFTAKVLITSKDWNRIIEAFTELSSVPPIKNEHKEILTGLDGSTWLLESVRAGKYKQESFWCPDAFLEKEMIKILVEELGEDEANPIIDYLATYYATCNLFSELSDINRSSKFAPAKTN